MRISDWSSDVCSSDLNDDLRNWTLTPGDLPREVDLHRLADAARDLLLSRGRGEECDVVLVRDEARFEQHGRGIGRLQHDEGGEAVRGGAEDRKSTRLNSSH